MANVELDDDGACGDPECCGGATYWIKISCPTCGEEETNEFEYFKKEIKSDKRKDW